MLRLCRRYAGFGGRVGIIEVSSCINLSLSARDEPETGSICDIVVREQITLQGALHRYMLLPLSLKLMVMLFLIK